MHSERTLPCQYTSIPDVPSATGKLKLLYLFRGHPPTVLFLADSVFLWTFSKKTILFKTMFLFPVSKEIRAKESKDKSELQNNYRPLSCASALGKLTEHIY